MLERTGVEAGIRVTVPVNRPAPEAGGLRNAAELFRTLRRTTLNKSTGPEITSNPRFRVEPSKWKSNNPNHQDHSSSSSSSRNTSIIDSSCLVYFSRLCLRLLCPTRPGQGRSLPAPPHQELSVPFGMFHVLCRWELGVPIAVACSRGQK